MQNHSKGGIGVTHSSRGASRGWSSLAGSLAPAALRVPGTDTVLRVHGTVIQMVLMWWDRTGQEAQG